MKIGIHNEPSGGGIGGSEICVTILAEALAKSHEVEIIHHKKAFTRERLARYSGATLARVGLRYVAPEAYLFGSSWNPWRRYKNARQWRAHISDRYDLFISFVHGVPPFCHAPRGVLTILFPFYEPEGLRAKGHIPSGDLSQVIRGLKRAYHGWEWKRRVATYQEKSAISCFTQMWTKRRWGVECKVIYPPVNTAFDEVKKDDVILSVGRFATEGHSKKQLEMLGAFDELLNELPDWDYFTVGALSDSTRDRAYFEQVRIAAEKTGANAIPNIELPHLKGLYQRSKIFWHAAGFGEDEDRPELSEHFGIATVEAMAAGCVPVVINKGAQAEIVEHGVNGFLWNTLGELKQFSLRVARDEHLRIRMAEAARCRAQEFSTANFLRQYSTLLGL